MLFRDVVSPPASARARVAAPERRWVARAAAVRGLRPARRRGALRRLAAVRGGRRRGRRRGRRPRGPVVRAGAAARLLAPPSGACRRRGRRRARRRARRSAADGASAACAVGGASIARTREWGVGCRGRGCSAPCSVVDDPNRFGRRGERAEGERCKLRGAGWGPRWRGGAPRPAVRPCVHRARWHHPEQQSCCSRR